MTALPREVTQPQRVSATDLPALLAERRRSGARVVDLIPGHNPVHGAEATAAVVLHVDRHYETIWVEGSPLPAQARSGREGGRQRDGEPPRVGLRDDRGEPQTTPQPQVAMTPEAEDVEASPHRVGQQEHRPLPPALAPPAVVRLDARYCRVGEEGERPRKAGAGRQRWHRGRCRAEGRRRRRARQGRLRWRGGG